jgi:uncharacterized protein
MNDSNFVVIDEILLKAEKDSVWIVVLKENKDSDTSLTMVVGEPEFLASAKEKKLIQTPRPLTHELYLNILAETRVELLQVEIHDLREKAYWARVVYQKEGIKNTADARPSDALALAINRNLPIRVDKKLLRKVITPEQIETYKDLIKSVKF